MLETKILLVSDDATLISSVQSAVQKVAHCCLATVSASDASTSCLESSDVALVIAHLLGPDNQCEITCLLQQIAKQKRSLPTLVVSNGHDDSLAISALRAGATEWLSRPLDLNRLAYLIDSLTLQARHYPASQRAESKVADDQGLSDDCRDLFGCCNAATTAEAARLRRVAANEITVLLKGETGVGKTRMAQRIHQMSPRRKEPLLVVNCAALPEQLLESELFGHVKGAFTGADTQRVGKFAAVGKGTLLLDEVDSLPLVSQAKLLRVVDERVFEPLGSNETIQCQARLIVATNRDLQTEVAEGRFRADLLYRLNVICFQIFALRERPAAIATLAERFVSEFAERFQSIPPHISSEAMSALQQYSWPGNIRELSNAMQRAVALCVDEVIRVGDLPECIAAKAAGATNDLANLRLDGDDRLGFSEPHRPVAQQVSPVAQQVPQLEPTDSALRRLNPAFNQLAIARARGEIRRICEVLVRCEDNRTKAAEQLGISRTALYNKLHKFGIVTRP